MGVLGFANIDTRRDSIMKGLAKDAYNARLSSNQGHGVEW